MRADGKDTKRVPVAWTADFVEKNSDGTYKEIVCDWVTGFNNSSDNNSVNSVRSFSVNAQEETNLGNIEDKKLKETASVNDKDLSMVNGKMNTANCYIVNGPGTYKFPLVYGNAIKNSERNSNAYTCKELVGVYGSFLKTFVNHLDLAITSPFIEENKDAEDNNLQAKGAKVVWQQVKDMITVNSDVALTEEKITVDGKEQMVKYLHFTVDEQKIKQGNAIIAVTDAKGTIMWSWHIWVTPYQLGKDDITLTDAARNTTTVMMPCNIGYVTNDKIQYKGREVYLRITQSEKSKEEDEPRVLYIPIKQEEYERQNLGSNTLYQHGRKDPMPGPTKKYTAGKNEISGIETIWFGDYETSTVGLTLGEAIQNPGKCISSGGDWTSQDRYIVPSLNSPTTEIFLRQILNLWRSGKKGNSKSVYDPSPAGFMVPTLEDVKYFYWPKTGNSYSLSDLNTPWDKTEVENQMSLAFYTHKAASKDDKPTDESLIYFPLTGSTDNKESVATNYWVRERANNGTSIINGAICVMQKENIQFLSNGSSTGNTYAIRPVKEAD